MAQGPATYCSYPLLDETQNFDIFDEKSMGYYVFHHQLMSLKVNSSDTYTVNQ